MTEHFLAPTRQLTSQAWERTAPMPALARPLRTLLTVPLLAFAILAAASAFAPATDASAASAFPVPGRAQSLPPAHRPLRGHGHEQAVVGPPAEGAASRVRRAAADR